MHLVRDDDWPPPELEELVRDVMLPRLIAEFLEDVLGAPQGFVWPAKTLEMQDDGPRLHRARLEGWKGREPGESDAAFELRTRYAVTMADSHCRAMRAVIDQVAAEHGLDLDELRATFRDARQSDTAGDTPGEEVAPS